MRPPIVYPYPTLIDADPVLTVTRLKIDGKPKPDWLRKDESTVLLFEHQVKWQSAELEFELVCPLSAVTKFEDAHGPVSAIVVAHCLPTNNRENVRLTRSGTDAGRWSGMMEIDRDNYRGRVKLECTLAAYVQGPFLRPIGTANEWVIHVDEPETFRLGKCLPVKWHDFTRSDSPLIAQAFQSSTHVVDFSGSLPTLFLNSAFTGLEALLKDRKDRKGADKAIHDILRTGIARSVWLALLKDSLAGIQIAEDESEDWPETPWRVEVLRHILPDVAPGKSEAELLSMAVNDWRDEGYAGDLFARAEAVIGEFITANEVVRRFVQKLPEEVIG
jgi:hypothetical protein